MGKKDKKKGKGAEKTAAKTDKKLSQKMKKELAVIGEDDIEKIVAEIEQEERKKQQVVIKVVPPPSCRCNFSFTAHPEKDELILFGGEFFNGQKTFLYNDLYFYNIGREEWSLVKAPGGPPPRCSHQTVAVSSNKGQLWVFGGEYASPSQAQFYHYRDLWLFHIADNKWEKILCAGAPSSRSGHRMICVKKQLIVFGGFHDNLRDYKYFNDVYAFNLDTRLWTEIKATGTPPSPRSACQMVATADGKVLIFGGYSKVKVKKDVDKGTVHTDAFLLTPEKGDTTGTKWKWSTVKPGGAKYSSRCGVSLAVGAGCKAYTFGGVWDQEQEDGDNIAGTFYSELHMLELDKLIWRTVTLSGKKDRTKSRRRKLKETGESGEANSDGEEEMDTNSEQDVEMQTVSDDGIFTVKVGPVLVDQVASQSTAVKNKISNNPHPRMNAGLVVKHGILYLYGGIFEEGDKQYTLSDLYSLDLHKLDEWKTLVSCDLSSQEWLSSGSEADDASESEEDEKDDSEDDDDDDDDGDDNDDDDDDDDDHMDAD